MLLEDQSTNIISFCLIILTVRIKSSDRHRSFSTWHHRSQSRYWKVLICYQYTDHDNNNKTTQSDLRTGCITTPHSKKWTHLLHELVHHRQVQWYATSTPQCHILSICYTAPSHFPQNVPMLWGGGSGPQSTMSFFGPIWLTNPNYISIQHAVFYF